MKSSDLAEDISWMVGTYEPRVTVEDVEVTAEDAVNGRLNVTLILAGGGT
ncbi:MAG TPA: hypothetical protein IAC67_03720 [Candidatus Coproplasma excrementipullorum]|nr:hypothetical protein [Candidatus Coproplasma excrementipullorum]